MAGPGWGGERFLPGKNCYGPETGWGRDSEGSHTDPRFLGSAVSAAPVCSDESETWGSESSPLLWAALGECAKTPDGRIQRRPAGKGTSWASVWSLGILGSIRQKHQHGTRAELEGGFRLGGVPG